MSGGRGNATRRATGREAEATGAEAHEAGGTYKMAMRAEKETGRKHALPNGLHLSLCLSSGPPRFDRPGRCRHSLPMWRPLLHLARRAPSAHSLNHYLVHTRLPRSSLALRRRVHSEPLAETSAWWGAPGTVYYDGASTHADSILTHEHGALDETRRALRDAVRRFAHDHVAPYAALIDASNRFPREQLWPRLGELGALGVTASPEHGGLGLGYTEHCLVMEELSRASASVGLSYGAHSNLCVQQIERHGTAEQKQAVLPRLCRGEWYAHGGATGACGQRHRLSGFRTVGAERRKDVDHQRAGRRCAGGVCAHSGTGHGRQTRLHRVSGVSARVGRRRRRSQRIPRRPETAQAGHARQQHLRAAVRGRAAAGVGGAGRAGPRRTRAHVGAGFGAAGAERWPARHHAGVSGCGVAVRGAAAAVRAAYRRTAADAGQAGRYVRYAEQLARSHLHRGAGAGHGHAGERCIRCRAPAHLPPRLRGGHPAERRAGHSGRPAGHPSARRQRVRRRVSRRAAAPRCQTVRDRRGHQRSAAHPHRPRAVRDRAKLVNGGGDETVHTITDGASHIRNTPYRPESASSASSRPPRARRATPPATPPRHPTNARWRTRRCSRARTAAPYPPDGRAPPPPPPAPDATPAPPAPRPSPDARAGQHEQKTRRIRPPAHAVIAGAVTAADDHAQFGHRGARHRVHHLGAVLGDAAPLGLSAYHETDHVVQEEQRHVPLFTQLDKVGALLGRLAEQHALVGHDAHCVAVKVRPPGHQRAAVARFELVQLRVVHQPRHHLIHVDGGSAGAGGGFGRGRRQYTAQFPRVIPRCRVRLGGARRCG
eukprot:ctg_1879.g566